MRIVAIAVLVCACMPPRGANRAGTEPTGLDPDACGNLADTELGRKLHAFLVASVELDRATAMMEQQIHGACAQMAGELGMAGDGDTKTVCQTVANELKADLPQNAIAKLTPGVCTTDMSVVAQAAAECEGRAPGDMAVTCEGEPGAECHGYASVDASAECKSSAEVHACVQTRCTEPRLELAVVDDAKAKRAVAALRVGLPTLLAVAARGEVLGKAAAGWAETAQNLANAPGDLIAALGAKSVCVAGQLSATAATITNIQARFSVAVDVQASFTAGNE